MRLFMFVAAPILVLAQNAQNSINSNPTTESKTTITASQLDPPSPTLKNDVVNPMRVSRSDKSLSVIGASDDTIIVFVPTTASMTITEKSVEQQFTTYTRVAETTFVSVSISVHATTILPTIRRPILRGSGSLDSGSMSMKLHSAVAILVGILHLSLILIIM